MIAVLLCFIVQPVTLPELCRLAGVTLLLAVFIIPAYLAAWAMPHTSADLFLYCLVTIGLALGAVVVSVKAALLRPTSKPMEVDRTVSFPVSNPP
jgi:hypothetical protein